ncbi:MAG TPA: VOC family protein [Stellaceae bacterium]
MIDHISIPVSNLAASATLYERMLEPLGLVCLVRRDGTVGFGKRYPEFWLNARAGLPAAPKDSGAHICLRARDESAVRAFFAAALAGGCASDGDPGPRQAAMTGYFAAFIRDHDGNRIEAATFPRAG